MPKSKLECIDSALTAKVVQLALVKTPEYKIAEALGITPYMVAKIRKSDDFAGQLKEIEIQTKRETISVFRSDIARLADKATKALEQGLDEGKLDAVRIFCEIMGIREKTDDGDSKGGSLVVYMPGAITPEPDKAIEVESTPVDDQS